MLIRDIRITGKDHTAEDSVTEYIKYSAEQAAFDWIKKERGEHKAALPYQEISLLFRKEQKGFEKPKEQEKERKEEIQYYITKTAEKQIHLESEYTKKEIQEQEKELLLVKTALKQQQEKIEEMERNQLKEINSEKIYQMVMKKMEAQLRLERLRRGLS